MRLITSQVATALTDANQERQARLDEEFEAAEALPPVGEGSLETEADYTAALKAGEALVFEPGSEDDEEEERRARARRAAHLEDSGPDEDREREREREREEHARERAH